MPKRFSVREMALLTFPVLLIGAMSWRFVKHLKSPVDHGKPRVTFHIEKPTTLEAFDGNAGTFVLFLDVFTHPIEAEKSTLYLELQQPPKLRSSTLENTNQILWKQSNAGFPDTRSAFKNRRFSPGNLYFGFDGIFKSWDAQGTQTLIRIDKKWQVDRAQLKAPNLAAMPRKPSISLLAFRVITIQTAQPDFSAVMIGEAIFKTDAAATNSKTPFEMRLVAALGSRDNPRLIQSKVPNQWKAKWTIFFDESKPILSFSGRASADNRWPLGFQIEPFNFNTVKFGQKLRFKSFPVPLPKF